MQLQRMLMVHLLRIELWVAQMQLTQVHSVLCLRHKVKNMTLQLQLQPKKLR